MGLIVVSAQLVLSECRTHGSIVFGDGSMSEEVFSREDAFAQLHEGRLAGKIIEAEADFLHDEINRSAIPRMVDLEKLREGQRVVMLAPVEEQVSGAVMPPSNQILH